MNETLSDIVRHKIQDENIDRLKTMAKVLILIHLILFFTFDLYNYLSGLWEDFPIMPEVVFVRAISLIPMFISLWLNLRYLKGKSSLPYNLLLLLNIIIIYPFVIYFSYINLNYFNSPSILVLYISALCFVLRIPRSQVIFGSIFFSLSFFGLLFYSDKGYHSNATSYADGISVVVFYYFISLGLYDHARRKIKNETLVTQQNEELREYQNTITKQNQELKDSNESLSNFAHLAAHDIKSPLHTISGFSHLLRKKYKDKMPPQDQELQDMVISGCQELSNIVDNLLEFSKTNSDRNLVFQTIDLNELIPNIIGLLQQNIHEKQASIHVAENFPKINGVKELIQNLFINLLSNAIKFQEEGKSPIIHISHQMPDPQFVEIRIQDNGIGIEKKYLDEIFQLFRKLNSSSSFDGTGIGLATCRKIVNKHGGEIRVESEYGVGSTFIFTLKRF